MTEFSVTTTQRLVHAACEACPPLKSKYFVITSATLMSLGVALVCSGVALHFFTDYYSLAFSFYGIGGMFIVAPPAYCLFRLISSCKKGPSLELDSPEESGSDTESSVSSDYSYYSDPATEDPSSDFSGTESASDSETEYASDSEEELEIDSETQTIDDSENSWGDSENSRSYRNTGSEDFENYSSDSETSSISRSPSPLPTKTPDREITSEDEKEGEGVEKDPIVMDENAILSGIFSTYPPQIQSTYFSGFNFGDVYGDLQNLTNWTPPPVAGISYGNFKDNYQFIHIGFYTKIVTPIPLPQPVHSHVLLVKSPQSQINEWRIYCSGFVQFATVFDAQNWLRSMAEIGQAVDINSMRTLHCSFTPFMRINSV